MLDMFVALCPRSQMIDVSVEANCPNIRYTKSAYHFYGNPDNSGENSNGTVHSGGNFPEKSNTFRGITFSHFYISLFGNAFKSSTICQKFFTEISLQMESAPRVGIPNEALKTMLTSQDPSLRLSPVPTRFSRNFFRFAFLTILDPIKLQMYVNNEVRNYTLQFPPEGTRNLG